MSLPRLSPLTLMPVPLLAEPASWAAQGVCFSSLPPWKMQGFQPGHVAACLGWGRTAAFLGSWLTTLGAGEESARITGSCRGGRGAFNCRSHGDGAGEIQGVGSLCVSWNSAQFCIFREEHLVAPPWRGRGKSVGPESLLQVEDGGCITGATWETQVQGVYTAEQLLGCSTLPVTCHQLLSWKNCCGGWSLKLKGDR